MHKSEASDQLDPWLRSRSMEDVFEHHLDPLGVPIVHNLPLGHGKHLWTLPLGATATVDADARTVTVDEPALGASAAPAERAASR
jgi:muramoyltetrapeptide carboxypeptidase LdcA involved in peptidoglycan recycling